MTPRLQPLPAPEWDATVRAALGSLLPPERANPRDAGNVLATMVRHPALTGAYLPFNAYLLNGSTLSPRIREIAILRAVLRSDCEYLWAHHLPIARRAGLTDSEIDAIRGGTPATAADAAVARAADELVDTRTVSAAVWKDLGCHFTDDQRMDLVFTIGGYCLLAMAVNAFGVEEENT